MLLTIIIPLRIDRLSSSLSTHCYQPEWYDYSCFPYLIHNLFISIAESCSTTFSMVWPIFLAPAQLRITWTRWGTCVTTTKSKTTWSYCVSFQRKFLISKRVISKLVEATLGYNAELSSQNTTTSNTTSTPGPSAITNSPINGNAGPTTGTSSGPVRENGEETLEGTSNTFKLLFSLNLWVLEILWGFLPTPAATVGVGGPLLVQMQATWWYLFI